MFAAEQILFSAVVGGVVSLIALALWGRWSNPARGIGWRDIVLQALVVAVSIVLWRTAGNTAVLNEDPIPLVSPNDVLCPVLTYVCLGLYAAARGRAGELEWQRRRALLTLVSFVVNVVTI